MIPVAGRVVPTDRTARRRSTPSILSPRKHLAPVFDIFVVLVQHLIPFVVLWRDAPGLTRTCTTTSHGRRTQRIVHAAGCVVFAENQICGIQGIPAYILRYGIIRHKQAVVIFVLLCILLGGCRLRCKLIGIHCPGVGKGNIMHCFVRQRIVHRAGDALAGEVKVIGAAGIKVELLLDRMLLRTDNGVEPDNIEIFQILHRWIAGAILAEHNQAKVGILRPVIGVQRFGKCLIVRIARNGVAVECQGSLICDGLLRVEGEIQQIDVVLLVSIIRFQLFGLAVLLPQRGAKLKERQATGGCCRAISYLFAFLRFGEGNIDACQRLRRRILVTLGKDRRWHKA